MDVVFTYFDIVLVPIYLLLILLISTRIKSKYIAQFAEYKYFTKGILFKLLGVSAFISIYLFYYGGGDTINYFRGAKAVGNLLVEDYEKGIDVLFNISNDSPPQLGHFFLLKIFVKILKRYLSLRIVIFLNIV